MFGCAFLRFSSTGKRGLYRCILSPKSWLFTLVWTTSGELSIRLGISCLSGSCDMRLAAAGWIGVAQSSDLGSKQLPRATLSNVCPRSSHLSIRTRWSGLSKWQVQVDEVSSCWHRHSGLPATLWSTYSLATSVSPVLPILLPSSHRANAGEEL